MTMNDLLLVKCIKLNIAYTNLHPFLSIYHNSLLLQEVKENELYYKSTACLIMTSRFTVADTTYFSVPVIRGKKGNNKIVKE